MDNTPQDPHDSLLLMLERCGSQKATAEKLGISPQYINDLLRGRREFSAKIAVLLGWRREVVFYPLEDCAVSLLPINTSGLTEEQREQADRPLVIVREGRE